MSFYQTKLSKCKTNVQAEQWAFLLHTWEKV